MTETPAAVAGKATQSNAFPMSDLALLGTLTAPAGDIALVRTPRGRVRRVTTGDTVSGATVSAITDGRLHLTRRGEAQVIAVPHGQGGS